MKPGKPLTSTNLTKAIQNGATVKERRDFLHPSTVAFGAVARLSLMTLARGRPLFDILQRLFDESLQLLRVAVFVLGKLLEHPPQPLIPRLLRRAFVGRAVAGRRVVLLAEGRVDFIFPADYREGTMLDTTMKNILRKMAIADALAEENAAQLRAIRGK